jgi:hypothetical protein
MSSVVMRTSHSLEDFDGMERKQRIHSLSWGVERGDEVSVRDHGRYLGMYVDGGQTAPSGSLYLCGDPDVVIDLLSDALTQAQMIIDNKEEKNG